MSVLCGACGGLISAVWYVGPLWGPRWTDLCSAVCRSSCDPGRACGGCLTVPSLPSVYRRQAIKDELKDQQRPVSSVLDQVQDVTEKGGDVLSKDETKQLDKNARELRLRSVRWPAAQ